MTITASDIFSTIIPLTLQGDGPQRAYIAYAAVKAAVEARDLHDKSSVLEDALGELWLMFHDLDGWGQ